VLKPLSYFLRYASGIPTHLHVKESHWDLRNLVQQRYQSSVRVLALRPFIRKDYCYLMTFDSDYRERFGVLEPTLSCHFVHSLHFAHV
jgi:hypothetical protein